MIRALPLLLCAGCTFSSGDPFGNVTADLDAHYEERADRDQGDGWQKLVNELEVQVSEATITVDAVELVDFGGADAVSFDPANPPAGYSLCHNGHCHHESGALVDYEDIVAELGGDTSSARVTLVMSGGSVDLRASELLGLTCDGPCMLGMGHVARARVGVSNLRVVGSVRDGLAEPRFDTAIPFDVEILGGVLEAALDLPFDDDHEPEVGLHLHLTLTAALFDAAIDDDGVIDAGAVTAGFAETNLQTTIERKE